MTHVKRREKKHAIGDGESIDHILILVHPGSMYGSARAALGYSEARAGREDVLYEVHAHQGGIVVIDGMLSDEIPGKDNLIITEAIARAAGHGLPALRLWGCDAGEAPFEGWVGIGAGPLTFTSQQEAAAAIADQLGAQPILVTGAWASHEKSEGCVNSVADTLREALGPDASIFISQTAIYMKDNIEDTPGMPGI